VASGAVDDGVDSYNPLPNKKSPPANGKKTKGRVKIKMEYIDNKLRRYTTFSKRKTGIMKKVRSAGVPLYHSYTIPIPTTIGAAIGMLTFGHVSSACAINKCFGDSVATESKSSP